MMLYFDKFWEVGDNPFKIPPPEETIALLQKQFGMTEEEAAAHVASGGSVPNTSESETDAV